LEDLRDRSLEGRIAALQERIRICTEERRDPGYIEKMERLLERLEAEKTAVLSASSTNDEAVRPLEFDDIPADSGLGDVQSDIAMEPVIGCLEPNGMDTPMPGAASDGAEDTGLPFIADIPVETPIPAAGQVHTAAPTQAATSAPKAVNEQTQLPDERPRTEKPSRLMRGFRRLFPRRE
jgi:hypothetical protein